MAGSFSNLGNNLAEEIHKLNTMIKNVKLEESNVNTVTAFLNTQTLNMI